MTKHCNTCDFIEFDYCHSSLRIAALNGVWNQKMAHDHFTGLNCEYWMERSKDKNPRLNTKDLYDKCSKCGKSVPIGKLKTFAKGSKSLCEDCLKENKE
jgi:hypothetical protein